MQVRMFLRELLREWLELMGCAAFTFIGIYAAARNKSNPWVVSSSAILAIMFFLIASFRIWKRQHDAFLSAARDVEEERGRPDVFLNCNDEGSYYAFYPQVSNDRAAHHLTLSSIAITTGDDGVIVRFDSVATASSSLGGNVFIYYIDGAGTLQRKDLKHFMKRDSERTGQSEYLRYKTTLAYSNSDGRRWKTDYELEYNCFTGELKALNVPGSLKCIRSSSDPH